MDSLTSHVLNYPHFVRSLAKFIPRNMMVEVGLIILKEMFRNNAWNLLGSSSATSKSLDEVRQHRYERRHHAVTDKASIKIIKLRKDCRSKLRKSSSYNKSSISIQSSLTSSITLCSQTGAKPTIFVFQMFKK